MDAVDPFSAQPIFALATVPTQGRDFAFGLLELHEVHRGPPLKLVKYPSQPFLQGVSD